MGWSLHGKLEDTADLNMKKDQIVIWQQIDEEYRKRK